MRRGVDDGALTIERLNARGEGVAADGRVFSYALPGDEVVGTEVVDCGPGRATPICRHFTQCGGCAAQHMALPLYAAWKRSLVVAALKTAGVQAEVAPLVDAHGVGRRRATFHARFLPHAHDEVGFMRARSHEIIEIEACPLFEPGLVAALTAARSLAAQLRGLGKPLDIQATVTLAGLDIDIRGTGPLGATELRKLALAAEQHDLARVSNHGRAIVERRTPLVRFGAARVVPPAGGFLQATLEGEEKMATLAGEALTDANRIADLFCGAGAFALRLGEGRAVRAIDSDAAAIAALKAGRGGAPGLERVTGEARDLFSRPFSAQELRDFDGALFDPPRAGALAQAKELAKSRVPVVVAISCNAETFARDARVLVDSGYEIGRVTPLDQFRYSPHVEIVAAFRRSKAAKRPRGVFG